MAATDDALSGDPMIGAHFEVSVGKVKGYFTEVSGLGSERRTISNKSFSPRCRNLAPNAPNYWLC
jgi:hypothetical protein